MRLIHLSDIHLTANGNPIWGVEPLVQFNKAIEKISSINEIDAIVISGDLSDDGSLWTYEYIDKTFAKLGVPTYCCPGNHDNLNVFYQGFQPSFYLRDEVFKLGEWTFIMLNSVMPGMSRGHVDVKRLSDTIQSSDEPIAVVVHHPPIEQDGWLNRKLMENRDEFNNIIIQDHRVELVLYGHSHCYTNKSINGIIYSSASSIGFAFHPNLSKFEIAHGNEGFSLVTLNGLDVEVENVLI
jgi:Icc protein